jgi:hypothetical protein
MIVQSPKRMKILMQVPYDNKKHIRMNFFYVKTYIGYRVHTIVVCMISIQIIFIGSTMTLRFF